MSLIDVPGSELLRVHDALQRVQELMASGAIRSMGNQVRSLGQRELQAAARDFERSWNDGRHVVDKDLRDVRDASKTVADAFQQVDDAVVAALEDPGPQQPDPQQSPDLPRSTPPDPGSSVGLQAVVPSGDVQTVLDRASTSSLPGVTGAGR